MVAALASFSTRANIAGLFTRIAYKTNLNGGEKSRPNHNRRSMPISSIYLIKLDNCLSTLFPSLFWGSRTAFAKSSGKNSRYKSACCRHAALLLRVISMGCVAFRFSKTLRKNSHSLVCRQRRAADGELARAISGR